MKIGTVFACAATLMLIACAGAPAAREPAASETETAPAGPAPASREWPYTAPPEVSEADASDCGRKAEEAAHAAVSGMGDTNAGVLFGAIGGALGAVIQLKRAERRMNAAYEQAFKACLRERGYQS